MSKAWPMVPLGEVLTRSTETITISPELDYRQITVKLWGKGVILRGIASGAEIAGGRRFLAKADQLILSQIDARNGAIGIVPRELDGAVVTNDFPLFDLHRTKIETGFLGWLGKTRGFVELCQGASEGTTNRVRLQEERFLALEIPLPPLPEQRRIVARIEALATKIKEAHGLRGQASIEAAQLYERTRDQLFRELRCERRPIGDLFELVNGRAFKPDEWQEHGRKIIRIQNLKYSDAQYNKYDGPVAPKHLVHSGDVLFAWSGQVVSLGAHIWEGEEAILNQYIFNIQSKNEFVPEFIKEGLNALIDEMKEQVRGLEMFHIRKQELERFLFSCPSVPEQRRIVAYLDGLQAKVDALKKLQAETSAELDALLPSILDKAFKGKL